VNTGSWSKKECKKENVGIFKENLLFFGLNKEGKAQNNIYNSNVYAIRVLMFADEKVVTKTSNNIWQSVSIK